MDKNIGKKLDGRYEITELIGVGGMADVYKGLDVIDNKPVAIKILKTEFAENEEFLRRFRNESKAIAVLSHPNIVKIYDVGFSEELQFIIMEYIDGITLKDYMEDEKVLSWKDSVHFAIQILRALQHAHDKGVVHRDIKPQNIMMFTDGTIKVMDFGIAKFSRDEGKTSTDQAIGSVHYISPEQAKGSMTDERSDIYSVGILLYEMLTGRKPFDSEKPVSVAVMHMNDIADRPKSINPEIPDGLEEIVLRAMEKEPENRYQSTSEMVSDIEEFKANPKISFGYYVEDINMEVNIDNDANSTRFFDAINDNSGMPAPVDSFRTAVKTKDSYGNRGYDIDENEDDEEEEYTRPSLVVPVLTAVTIVVIICAVVFVGTLVKGLLKSKTNTSSPLMPELIGMDFYEAANMYPNLILTNEGEEWSEYPKDVIIWQNIEKGAKISDGEKVKVKISRGQQTVEVPDVTNTNYVLAQNRFLELGIEVEIKEELSDLAEGQVIRSEPEAGQSVNIGSTVILYISNGGSPDGFLMDSLLGRTIDDAIALCEYRGLKWTKKEENSYELKDKVTAQSIAPGTETKKGTDIILTVSNGEPPEGMVDFRLNMPSDANGSFTLYFMIDGFVAAKSRTFMSGFGATSITTSVPYTGTSVPVTVILENGTRRETLGTYVFNFSDGSYRTSSENIMGAFDAVDGLIKQTEPPTVPTTEPTTVVTTAPPTVVTTVPPTNAVVPPPHNQTFFW